MESRDRESSSTSGGVGGVGALGGEFKNLKQHGTATVAEVREFVGQMRGKGPREMLGALAESGLVRATVQATIGCVVLLGLLTAGPYLMGSGKSGVRRAAGASQAANAKASGSSKGAADSATDSSAANVAADSTTGDNSTKSSPLEHPPIPGDIEGAAKKLGVGDTKHADPKVNPLDKELDNLLDKAK